jgi:hypothetical protein
MRVAVCTTEWMRAALHPNLPRNTTDDLFLWDLFLTHKDVNASTFLDIFRGFSDGLAATTRVASSGHFGLNLWQSNELASLELR